MRKFLYLIVCIVFISAMLSGCAERACTKPAAALPEETASSEEPEHSPDTDALADMFAEKWKEEKLKLILPEDFFEEPRSKYIMDTGLGREWVETFAQSIESELEKAAEHAISAVAPDCAYELCEFSITWQMAYALACAAENEDDAAGRMLMAYEPDIEWQGSGDELKAKLLPKSRSYTDILAAGGCEDASFIYVYANTLYDEKGDVKDYVLPEAEGNLASGIVWPLASHTRLRKTWYADRDGGTRRHTGTDIWAKEGTEIYSCTSGTVTGVYYNEKSGNAVVVTDEYGYEFHYYHMCALTDFLSVGDKVEAGDLLGYVGNTGNSSRNHLHLTIISDDGVFINPYPYLLAAEP